MNVKTFNLGRLMTNCHLYWDDNKTGYLFDCGGPELENLVYFIEKNDIIIKYLIITHGHGDHIEGLNKFIELFPDTKVYIGLEDEDFLSNPNLSLSYFVDGEDGFIFKGKYSTLKGGDYVGEFLVIDTPGHTIGSKSFYNSEKKILMSGDTMFKRSFGRYDLPTSDGTMLFNSLRELCQLPPDTVVFSGHTEETNIGDEKTFLTKYRFI